MWYCSFISAGREKINEEYKKHKSLSEPADIEKVGSIQYFWRISNGMLVCMVFYYAWFFILQLVKGSEEASEFLRTGIVQAHLNPERDVYGEYQHL